jgi:hypothetical protein
MVQDIFIEQTVQRIENPMTRILYLISFIFAVINYIFALIFLFYPMLLPAVLFTILAYILHRDLKVEFDYSYTNGIIDVAKVRNGSRRKHLCEISRDDLVVMAKTHTDPVKPYMGGGIKSIDATSHIPGNTYYVLIFKDKEGSHEKLLFEPDEEFRNMLKRMNPNQVNL